MEFNDSFAKPMIDVQDIMTPRRSLVIIGPDATVSEARRTMAAHGIRHLPVTDGDGRLLGLVSQTDLMVAGDTSEQPLAEIMVRELDTVEQHSNLRYAAMVMFRHKRSCLPVMSDGQLTGIITDSDFLGVAIALMEQLEAAEPEAEEIDEGLEAKPEPNP